MATADQAKVAFRWAKELYTSSKNSLISYLDPIPLLLKHVHYQGVGTELLMINRGWVEEAWEQYALAHNDVNEASPFLLSRDLYYDKFHALEFRKADLMDAMAEAIENKQAEADRVQRQADAEEEAAAAAKVAEEAAAAN